MPDFATIRTRLAMVGALVLLFVAILFALQNTQPIRVNLLFASTEGSAALVLVCAFTIGVLVGVLALAPARLRDRRRIKQLEKEQRSQGPGQGEASGPSAPGRSDADTQ
ncbi:MAG: LapA family protein [Longimonas sp.]|uniref:LapA family protein n=1 Tax=Longimonas sp. TaxID=2039626 RepID=UPI003975DBF6